MAEIKRSANWIEVIGSLQEVNLTIEEKEVELKGANGATKKVTCKQIRKKEFRNPSLTVKSVILDEDGDERYTTVTDVDFFPTNEKKLDENGKVIDNPRFNELKAVIEDFTPQIKATSENPATRVHIKGSLNANEYASAKDGKNFEFHSFSQVTGFSITTTSQSEDLAEGYITGVIRSIANEVRGEEAEETGRLKVEFFTFDYQGKATPINFIVDKDMADDFEDMYENGNSCKVNYEIVKRHVGGKKKATAFGRSSKLTSGFDVTEYVIFGGEEPYDEEHENYVDVADMKVAMANRQNYIDSVIADAKEKAKNGKSGSTEKKGLGRKPKTTEDEEFVNSDSIEDLPFFAFSFASAITESI